MKRLNKLCLAGTLLLSQCFYNNAVAAEVPHGTWTTDYQKIVLIESYWSLTYFKIDEVSSCGTNGRDQFWAMQTSHSDPIMNSVLKDKRSMLLAAFTANKSIKLRCEGGFISDFIISH